jgi:hypothetical protein
LTEPGDYTKTYSGNLIRSGCLRSCSCSADRTFSSQCACRAAFPLSARAGSWKTVNSSPQPSHRRVPISCISGACSRVCPFLIAVDSMLVTILSGFSITADLMMGQAAAVTSKWNRSFTGCPRFCLHTRDTGLSSALTHVPVRTESVQAHKSELVTVAGSLSDVSNCEQTTVGLGLNVLPPLSRTTHEK